MLIKNLNLRTKLTVGRDKKVAKYDIVSDSIIRQEDFLENEYDK